MSPRNPGDAILRAIEKQSEVSGRFSNLIRIGVNGGDGMFSLIVRAQDSHFDRPVALKFYNPEHLNDAYRWSCFQREAQILKEFVGCPDILQWVAPVDSFSLTFDHGGIKLELPFSYYAVELASSSVADAIAFDKWSLRRKLEQFRAMCRSVQRVHAAGVVHRDIKLSNFLVMKDGSIRLSDFGTAKSITDGSDPITSRYAVPVGDTTYAAPELFAALHDVEPTIYFKSDVYALGAALFEMLTGTPLNPFLFDESTIADLVRVMNAVPRHSRVRIYDEFVSSLDSSHTLPDLRYFGTDIAAGTEDTIESLYKGMCSIDYRRRLCDFNRLFSYLNRAIIIIDNDVIYKEWRRRRDLFRHNAELKRLRLTTLKTTGASK